MDNDCLDFDFSKLGDLMRDVFSEPTTIENLNNCRTVVLSPAGLALWEYIRNKCHTYDMMYEIDEMIPDEWRCEENE